MGYPWHAGKAGLVANLGKDMTIEEQLQSSISIVSGLTAERDDLRLAVEKLTVGAASELEALKLDASAKDAKVSELAAALEKAVAFSADLEVKISSLEAGKVSASKEAAKIAASVGVSPVQLSPSDSQPSAEAVDVLATFLSLPVGSKERSEFYAANKAAIVKAAL